jgi:hypothetical protein
MYGFYFVFTGSLAEDPVGVVGWTIRLAWVRRVLSERPYANNNGAQLAQAPADDIKVKVVLVDSSQ